MGHLAQRNLNAKKQGIYEICEGKSHAAVVGYQLTFLIFLELQSNHTTLFPVHPGTESNSLTNWP